MSRTEGTAILATLVLATLVLSACDIGYGRTIRGSGRVAEEDRSVGGVTRVNLATIGDLTIEMGDRESLRIEAEDNLMEYFETEVRGGTLRIETRQGVNLRTTRAVNYYLTVTSLDSIEISSSGDIVAPDVEAERFSVAISSSGDLDVGDLEADTVTVDISSSGDVSMGDLEADRLEVRISSAGNLNVAGGEVVRIDTPIQEETR